MNIVFDLYGTLVDVWTDETKEELWDGIALLLGDGEENGQAVKREYTALCRAAKKSDDHEIDLLSVFKEMLVSREVDPSVADALALEFRRLSMVRLTSFPGVADMLRELKNAGAGVYLLSNAQSCFTVDELHTTGLYDLFDGIAISSDLGVKKPWPTAFEAAFKRFNITADNSVYVGNDMRDDILGASGVGMRTVYIETEQSGQYPDMKIPSPDFVAADHADLCRILLSLVALDKEAAK